MQPNPVTVNLTTVHDLAPFSFQDIQLKEACWLNGQPQFTRRAIGEFLGYPNPNQSIRKIIERNPYIQQWATVVSLTTVEGGREVTREIEVFGPIGLQLLLFESRQQKAREYKIAVARLVWAYMNGQLRPPVDPSYLGQLRALDLLPRGQRGLATRALAQVKDCSTGTIGNHRALVRKGLDPSRKRHWTSMDQWDRRFAREKALVIAALAEGWSRVRIWRVALGSPAKPTYYMVCALAKRLARAQVPAPMTVTEEI